MTQEPRWWRAAQIAYNVVLLSLVVLAGAGAGHFVVTGGFALIQWLASSIPLPPPVCGGAA